MSGISDIRSAWRLAARPTHEPPPASCSAGQSRRRAQAHSLMRPARAGSSRYFWRCRGSLRSRGRSALRGRGDHHLALPGRKLVDELLDRWARYARACCCSGFSRWSTGSRSIRLVNQTRRRRLASVLRVIWNSHAGYAFGSRSAGSFRTTISKMSCAASSGSTRGPPSRSHHPSTVGIESETTASNASSSPSRAC